MKNWLFLCLCFPLSLMGQTEKKVISFEDTENYKLIKGKTEVVSDGYKGRSMSLASESEVRFPLQLLPGSKYNVTAWLKTSSGADNVSLQVEGLGRYNTGVSSALASWSKVEFIVNVPEGDADVTLCAVLGKTIGDTPAFVDEISIVRIGDFKEMKYTGIPNRNKREIKTEAGITMQPDEKIQWMLDDKLGMFVHWGLYSGPGKGEWYMENKGILPEEYRKLAYPESGDYYFTAKDFDASKWVALAKKAGMKYMNMVTQHHDGYALFESKYMNAFTSKQTHNRDFVKEYVVACREAGLKVGIYKTLINWRFPGYYDVTGTDCKPNKFGYHTDVSHKENARLMKEELYCQVKELMTNYGKIDQLFWDGGWLGQKGSDEDGAYFWESGKYLSEDSEWPVNNYFRDYEQETGKALGLMGIVRKYQPDIVVNPRSGWCGDYTCEEGGGAVKGEIRSGVVEKCISLSPGWGYNTLVENPEHVMSLNRIKRFCADCMIRNMCFLINVGPDRHGNIPHYTEQRLLEFGKWVERVGEAIYGTRGGPWEPVDGQYGFTYKGNRIYIYFLGGYNFDTFELPPLDKGMKVISAHNLSSDENVKFRVDRKSGIVFLKNLVLPRGEVTIISLELNRPVYD